MRFFGVLSLSIAAILLVGCAKHKNDYMKQANTVPPVATPKGIALKKGQKYYPLPAKANSNVAQPSLVPPGSELKRFAKSSTKKSPKITVAKWSQNVKGQPILVLSEKTDTAWADVGRALAETRYQVLDQDASMRSYYILDMTVTNNQITEKTPIYRIYLRLVDNNIQVQVLDQKNQYPTSDISKRILGDLQKHIS